MVSLSVMTMISAITTTAPTTFSHDQIVAACLIAEAGGEGDIGMCAVLSVIINRSKGSHDVAKWKAVVTKRKQFSCFNNGVDTAVKRAMNHEKWDRAMSFVTVAKNGNMIDYVKGATHYHVWKGQSKVSPSWSHPRFGGKNKKCVVTAVIGNHVFLSHVD